MDPFTLAFGLAKFAGPVVAKWLGGDKGAEAAQDVIAIAERVTGRKGIDAESAIAADPKLALQFKSAVMDNAKELDKLYLADRQDARDRDLKLHEMGYKNKRADIMIIVVGLALCLDIFLLSYFELKPEIIAIFNMMVGALLKMLGDAFSFEFGSSRGSKEKDFKN